MKKWLIIIGIVAIVLVSAYLTLSFFAVRLIQGQIQKLIGPGLTIKWIKLKPTYLLVGGIRYENPNFKKIFLDIEKIMIYPDIFSLLKKSIKINRISIIKPYFIIYRSDQGKIFFPLPDIGTKEERGDKEGRPQPISIYIENIKVENGRIQFEDEKKITPPAKIRFDGLNLSINNIHYPFASTNSPITLQTKIKGENMDGSLETKGWINIKSMDLEADLKVRNIEIKIFEPYYRSKISAEIEKGYMNMDTKISLKNRFIDAPGEMEIVDLKIHEGGAIFYIPAKILISRLKDRENRIKFKFRVSGNMDDPRFNINESLLTRIGLSLAETLGLPIKIVGEKIIEGTGVSAEKFIEGIKKIEELLKRKRSSQ